MVEFIMGGYDLSAYTEPKKLTVSRKNILEDIAVTDMSGVSKPRVIGCYYEVGAAVTALPEETATALLAASAANTLSATFPLPGEVSASKTLNFIRPEMTVAAVTEKSDGDYYDITIKLRSENIYSDDCL
ncbi:MAG: hypothetical protein LBL87_07360 [Ruminococcus sp.]|jgi:hypothetical protein|nr:hypothetical protein [Ruminococcus sp.]